MLLSSFLAFTGLGFGIWLLGHLLFQYENNKAFIAIAAIGAVVIMATGGAVALTDVEQTTGEVVVHEYQEAANVTTENASEIVYINNRSTVTDQRSRISLTDQFGAAFGQLGLGGLELIVGAILLSIDLEEVGF